MELLLNILRQNAIKVNNTTYFGAVDCKFSDLLGYFSDNCTTHMDLSSAAIHIQSSTNIFVLNCEIIHNQTLQAQTDGIYIDRTENITINDNYIYLKNDYYGTVTPHIDGIQITFNGVNYSKNIKIERNTVINEGIIDSHDHRQGIVVNSFEGYCKIINNVVSSAKGQSLFNISFREDANELSLFNNTLVGKGNPGNIGYIKKIGNADPALLNIKNNIFFKEGSTSDQNLYFDDINSTEIDAETNLNYNLHHYTFGTAKIRFENGAIAHNSYELNSIGTHPDFNNYNNNDFKLTYNSPAKNKGTTLYTEGVITDRNNNKRPYWELNAFGIGAYEIADAQFKLGALGSVPGQSIFTISSIGTYWERNSNGNFVISSNQNYATSQCTLLTADPDINNWKGWNFGWLNQGGEDPNKPFAHGFYKVHYNSDPSKYFYLDYRSANLTNSPNIQIQYNFTNNRFEYEDNSPIDNATIHRVWEINGSNAYTSNFANYWNNALLIFPNNNNKPVLAWGPIPSFSATHYKIYRALSFDQPADPSTLTFSLLATVNSSTYSFTDPEITISQTPSTFAYYYIKAYDGSYSEADSDPTNYVSAAGDYLPQKRNAVDESDGNLFYSLDQNFPNPFNPSTTISFTIENDERVEIKLYDILGREINTILNHELKAGNHRLNFDGSNLASGIYLYKLTAGKFTSMKKFQLLK